LTKTDYKTPPVIKAVFVKWFDPCPLGVRNFDGLKIRWAKRNFVNPPYDKKTDWIEKAIYEQKKGNTTVMLLPVDTSTRWFHDLVLPNAKIKFIKGRVCFNGNTPPFASMFCTFMGE